MDEKSTISPTRGYQIERYNKTNKDNIHVIFTEYKEDYYNLIRISLATDKGPDIFEYGFTSLLKNNQIATLDDIGFNHLLIDNSNIVHYMDKKIGVKLMETNAKIIWNKDIFKRVGLNPDNPPKTWQELVDYAEKIKSVMPNVTPFAFPIKEYKHIKVSIGEPSVNLATIYTSFWDYKKGVYDFSYAKPILEIYKDMYQKGLIDKEFENKSSNQLRSEFYQGNVAMMISTFEDKGYFSNILPLGFDIGISDVIQIGKSNANNYYYVDNDNFLVINQKSLEDEKKREAIKKVYEFLLSEDVNREILTTRWALPVNVKNYSVKNDIYSQYNDVKKYKNETHDPTLFLSKNSKYEIKQIVDAIKGEISIEDAIKNLNKQYEGYMKFAVDKEKFDFSFYKK